MGGVFRKFKLAKSLVGYAEALRFDDCAHIPRWRNLSVRS